MARKDRTGLVFEFTTPADFPALPAGPGRAMGSRQRCVFLVNEQARQIETWQPACDLVCTGRVPATSPGASYAHPE